MIFTELAKRPISGVNPAGFNPNDTDDFLNLKRQINKMNAVTASFSWRKIYSLSEQILSKTSKDFRCASYYVAAATHINGLKGLVDGLQVLHDLCVIYWFSATPEHHKEKARMDAFSWMIEHTEKNQKRIKIKEKDLFLIESGHRLTLKIDEELKLHYGISAPSLGPLRRLFSTWIEEIEDIQESKRKKSSIENTPQPVQNTQQPPVKVDLNLSTKNTQSKEHSSTLDTAPKEIKIDPKSTKKYRYSYVVGIPLLLILVFFSIQKVREHYYINAIEQANVHTFLPLLNKIQTSESTLKIKVKDILLNKGDTLTKNWTTDANLINQSNNLRLTVNKMADIYPDSSIAKKIKQNFELSEKELQTEFNILFKQFKRSRTTIANAYQKKNSQLLFDAYKLSNTLFPVLAKLEHVDINNNNQEQRLKAQRILNIYQYQLNNIGTDALLSSPSPNDKQKNH